VARAAVLGRLTWQAARLAARRRETATTATLVLDVPEWPGHRAGQHVDVRLTAEDGYTAQRSYSIASAPEAEDLEITVERLSDGEVSPYLVDDFAEGDAIELRGPIGGYFVWSADRSAPLQLIAGGSGLVPLMCMLRHRAARGGTAPTRLLLSARTYEDVLYREELERLGAGDGVAVDVVLTRAAPEGWTGRRGRIDAAFLAESTWGAELEPEIFICGPTSFVEVAAQGMVDSGHDPLRVKTERFGATGG